MEEQYKEGTIGRIVADIRNKLGPHWNLVSMAISGMDEQLLHDEAEEARKREWYILQQLEKIVLIAEEQKYTEQDMRECWNTASIWYSTDPMNAPAGKDWLKEYNEQKSK